MKIICPVCKGTGAIGKKVCETCKGSGEVESGFEARKIQRREIGREIINE